MYRITLFRPAQLAKRGCVIPFLNEIRKVLVFKHLERFFRSEAGNE
jgi:hypothetical protein